MTEPTPTDAPLPTVIDGPLVVVGDLHGAAQLLDRLLARLAAAVPDLADRWLVFAGDFPDRGPDTRRVIDDVLGLRDRHGRVTAGCRSGTGRSSPGCRGVSNTRSTSWSTPG